MFSSNASASAGVVPHGKSGSSCAVRGVAPYNTSDRTRSGNVAANRMLGGHPRTGRAVPRGRRQPHRARHADHPSARRAAEDASPGPITLCRAYPTRSIAWSWRAARQSLSEDWSDHRRDRRCSPNRGPTPASVPRRPTPGTRDGCPRFARSALAQGSCQYHPHHPPDGISRWQARGARSGRPDPSHRAAHGTPAPCSRRRSRRCGRARSPSAACETAHRFRRSSRRARLP